MKTINLKLLVSMLFFILTPLIMLGIISFKVASKALHENARRQYEQIVQTSQNIIDEKLEERLKQIRLIQNSNILAVFSGFSGLGSNKTSVDGEVYALQKGNGLILEPPKEEGDLINFGIMLVHPGNQRIIDFGLFPSQEYVGLDGIVKQHVYAGGSNDEDFSTEETAKLDRSQEIWFQEAKKGNLYISKPQSVKLYVKEYKPSEGIHPEKIIEKNLIIIAMPHVVQDQTRGVLMVTTTPDFLYNQINRLKPEQGQAFIINKAGDIIAHSDSKLIGTPLDVNLAKLILERPEGWLIYEDNLVIYNQNPLTGWKVGIYVLEKEILSPIDALRDRIIWIILSSLIIVGVIGTLFIRKLIIAPLKDMVTFAEAIRDGNLTKKLPVRTDDEIGKLGRALNAMLASMRAVTGRIRESSDRFNIAAEELGGHSSTLTTGAEGQYLAVEKISNSVQPLNQSILGLSKDVEDLFAAAEQTSASMLEMKATLEEVAGAMEDLSSSVNETASSIEEMTVSIKEVAANTGRLFSEAENTYQAINKINTSLQEVSVNVTHSRKLSEETTQAAIAGQRSMNETLEGMRGIKEVVLKSAQVIQNLGDRAEEIGAILDVMNDIAEQTSLLALNASIIAAQAGEHGRGFAVVAGEVRELAHRSTVSAKEIGNLIKNVQKEALSAIQAMQEGVQKVEDGVRLADMTGELLQQIITRAERSASTVSEIARASQTQADSSRQIMQYMENVTRMVSEITKATDEQQKGSSQIIVAVDSMRNLAEQVKRAMNEQTKGTGQAIHAMERVTEIALKVKNMTIEQTREATQIANAIEAIKEVIEKNLQTTKRTEQMADTMLEQSRTLQETVSMFKTE